LGAFGAPFVKTFCGKNILTDSLTAPVIDGEPVVWGILTLDKAYEKSDVNKACRSAIELSQVSLGAVRKLLSITATRKIKEKKNPLDEEFKTVNGKYTRPIGEYKSHIRLVTNNKPEMGGETK
jgi:hypothetical protein